MQHGKRLNETNVKCKGRRKRSLHNSKYLFEQKGNLKLLLLLKAPTFKEVYDRDVPCLHYSSTYTLHTCLKKHDDVEIGIKIIGKTALY